VEAAIESILPSHPGALTVKPFTEKVQRRIFTAFKEHLGKSCREITTTPIYCQYQEHLRKAATKTVHIADTTNVSSITQYLQEQAELAGATVSNTLENAVVSAVTDGIGVTAEAVIDSHFGLFDG
jgi:hypothetical protein